jgi:hypothetical protein
MRRVIIIFTLFSIFFGCNTTSTNSSGEVSDNVIDTTTLGQKFFDYDEIEYYFFNVDESKISDLYYNNSKSELDSIKKGVVLGEIPNDINSLSFIEWLEKIGYKKTSINRSKFSDLNKIFVEKPAGDAIMTACIYVYRDILIFKKNGKIVGVTKICFDCMANHIIGTKAYTGMFGQNGDYEKLYKILRL